ncbi:hypothetical protein [Deinococcus sp. UYEF24]
MTSGRILTVGALLLVGALSLRALAQSRSAKARLDQYTSVHSGANRLAPTSKPDARFPMVSGSNLERRTFNLPADFEGELNLVAVAFLREHQDLVDTWTPTAERLTETDPALRFYEVPVLSEANGMFSFFIDGGMRAGIPSRATREATITLYTDLEKFLKTAGLPGPQTIYLLLTDRAGRIFWRGEGAYTSAQGAALEEAIRRAR